jgi:NRPS condensation-like uncharacterized protein
VESIPERFPATGADMAVSITRAVTCHRIGLRLGFEGRALDPARLARAARLTLDAEPTLGCAFEISGRKAWWSRLATLDAVSCCDVRDTDDADAEMITFQAAEIPSAGPQVAVALLRAPDADHLGIKLSHVLGDGQAVKQYAYLLADTYTRLAADDAYRPRPNLAQRPTGRDIWERLTPEQRREARRAKSWVNPTWVVSSKGSSGEGLTYRTAFIEPELFRAMKSHGHERGATVNDMMLTAVFRTCVALLDPAAGVPLSLMGTADLRRHLPDSDLLPLSNISISGSLDIERVDGETFDETLSRVRESMGRWAKQCYGAGPFASAEKMTALGYGVTKWLMGLAFRAAGGSGKTYPWYTNIGVIEEPRLSFAGEVPTSGHMFGPCNPGGAVVPVISTYRERLAIAMGFCERDMDVALVEEFLAAVIGEVESACANEPSPSA